MTQWKNQFSEAVLGLVRAAFFVAGVGDAFCGKKDKNSETGRSVLTNLRWLKRATVINDSG
jgi:hypothetical protein